MRVTEPLLAVVVIALAAFVATQSTVHSGDRGQVASGTLGPAAEVTGDEAESDRAASRLSGPLRLLVTGRAEGRVAKTSSFVPDVPRDAAWAPADMRRRLAAGEPGTYMGALLLARDSMLTRWPDRRVTPLRVWVGDGGMHEGWNAIFPSVVRNAFDEWSATGIPVHFTYVRDSASADVRVTFVSQFPQGISGRTIWSRDSTWWLVGGDIELALSHPVGGVINEHQLRAIALHEVGHLLGLDHVDDPAHIMAPKVRVRSLSEADRATVRLLYSVPAGSVR
jgi:hypothetical protein